MAEGQNESLDTFIFSYLLNWTWNSWDQMSVLCFHSLIFPPVWTISHDVSAIKCILTFATETDSIVKSIDNFDFIFTFCIIESLKYASDNEKISFRFLDYSFCFQIFSNMFNIHKIQPP